MPCTCQRIDTPGLDPIHVFWLDVAPSAGYVTIICFGQAWTAYFGAMNGKAIREFFADCDVNYMVTKMGITPALKQGKREHAYLGRIIGAVRVALRETPEPVVEETHEEMLERIADEDSEALMPGGFN